MPDSSATSSQTVVQELNTHTTLNRAAVATRVSCQIMSNNGFVHLRYTGSVNPSIFPDTALPFSVGAPQNPRQCKYLSWSDYKIIEYIFVNDERQEFCLLRDVKRASRNSQQLNERQITFMKEHGPTRWQWIFLAFPQLFVLRRAGDVI